MFAPLLAQASPLGQAKDDSLCRTYHGVATVIMEARQQNLPAPAVMDSLDKWMHEELERNGLELEPEAWRVGEAMKMHFRNMVLEAYEEPLWMHRKERVGKAIVVFANEQYIKCLRSIE